MIPPPTSAARRRLLLGGLFVLGLGLSLLLVARSQTGHDQMNMLSRGWLLAEEGRWVPIGMPSSRGGNAPGGAVAVLVGLPLLLWRDHRAATLLLAGTHVLGYWLLDRVVRDVAGPRGRTLLAVLYWLNPWRLYFSGFLWNPGYMFAAGAIHAWTVYRQRRAPEFWSSLLLVAVPGVALQVHPPAVLLFVATGLLWLARSFRLHWRGAAVGAALVGASLVPWALVFEPACLPGHRGFPGRGLLLVYPLLRGVGYWLRYPSFLLSGWAVDFDFIPALGAANGPAVSRLARWFALVIGILTVVPAVPANIRLWRRAWGRGRSRNHPSQGSRRRLVLPPGLRGDGSLVTERRWLLGYVRWCFVAALLAFAIAPTTIMSWQVLPFFHAAVLAVVLWAALLGRTRLRKAVSRCAAIWVAACVLLALAMAFAGSDYTCALRDGRFMSLRGDHPMLQGLGITDTCPMSTNVAEGWWPDVLPGDPSPRPSPCDD